jgi:hypothetical protein
MIMRDQLYARSIISDLFSMNALTLICMFLFCFTFGEPFVNPILQHPRNIWYPIQISSTINLSAKEVKHGMRHKLTML